MNAQKKNENENYLTKKEKRDNNTQKFLGKKKS